MTLPIDTPTTFRDMRSNAAPRPGVSAVLFTGVMLTMVAGIVLIGWLAFTEITRCDPCEWVQFDAQMGEW